MFAKSLTDAGIRNYWIAGNHDVVDDSLGRSTLSPLSVVARVCEVEPVLIQDHAVDLLMLPYPPRTMRYDPAARISKLLAGREPGKKLFSFGHLVISGAEMGSESIDMARGSDVVYPISELTAGRVTLMFNGHYHKRQEVSGVVMPGTLERLRFDEETNQPGWLVLDV
jgi:DNA repair exonuclease SbcCD nuclease subunit